MKNLQQHLTDLFSSLNFDLTFRLKNRDNLHGSTLFYIPKAQQLLTKDCPNKFKSESAIQSANDNIEMTGSNWTIS